MIRSQTRRRHGTMEIIDNINRLLGDNLKQSIATGARLKIAASCFSIYAYEALKSELEKVESLEFIFTTPTPIRSTWLPAKAFGRSRFSGSR